MNIEPVEMLRAIVRRGFEAIVFFTPLLVFPWTVSPLEINKQVLFYVISTICILAWLGQVFLKKTFSFSVHKIWVVLGIFFFCVAVSSLFSQDSYTSIFGQSNQEYTSAVTLFFGIAIAFVGSQMLDAKSVRRILVVAIFSSAIVGIFGLSSFFGLTFDSIPTNVIGTPNALAIYLIVMAYVGSGLIMSNASLSFREKHILFFSTAVTVIAVLTILFAIDYSILWILVLFGSLCLFGLSLIHSSALARPIRLILPMVLLVSALFFLVLPTAIYNPFPTEVSLSSKSSVDIAAQVFQNGMWSFGTGPGTYMIDFARYHSADLNGTTFWDTRFDRGASGILTMLPTLGVFASVSFLFVIVWVSIFAVLAFRRAQHPSDLPVLVGWLILAFAWMVYPQNFVLAILFWVFLGLILRLLPSRHFSFSFERSPKTGLIAVFSFVLISVFILTVAFATLSKYRADVAFARAETLNDNGGDLDDVIEALDQAATLNRWSDVYYRNLGSALLQRVIELAHDSNSDPEIVKSFIGAAVNAMVRATELGPNNVVNWELRGDVYREVSPLVADAATFAITSYQEAVSLAPNNPRYAVSLARGYIAYVDVLVPIVNGSDEDQAAVAKQAQEDALTRASGVLLGAITLKSDYAEARYYLASVQERQGKLAEAVASMEIVRLSAPKDVGVGLQLALLYLRQGKNDVAQKELERVIALAPNFSNAHWYLAAVLESDDDVDGALMELETILRIDPGNEIVEKKITELRAGIIAAEIPDPLPSAETSILPDVEPVQ